MPEELYNRMLRDLDEGRAAMQTPGSDKEDRSVTIQVNTGEDAEQVGASGGSRNPPRRRYNPRDYRQQRDYRSRGRGRGRGGRSGSERAGAVSDSDGPPDDNDSTGGQPRPPPLFQDTATSPRTSSGSSGGRSSVQRRERSASPGSRGQEVEEEEEERPASPNSGRRERDVSPPPYIFDDAWPDLEERGNSGERSPIPPSPPASAIGDDADLMTSLFRRRSPERSDAATQAGDRLPQKIDSSVQAVRASKEIGTQTDSRRAGGKDAQTQTDQNDMNVSQGEESMSVDSHVPPGWNFLMGSMEASSLTEREQLIDRALAELAAQSIPRTQRPRRQQQQQPLPPPSSPLPPLASRIFEVPSSPRRPPRPARPKTPPDLGRHRSRSRRRNGRSGGSSDSDAADPPLNRHQPAIQYYNLASGITPSPSPSPPRSARSGSSSSSSRSLPTERKAITYEPAAAANENARTLPPAGNEPPPPSLPVSEPAKEGEPDGPAAAPVADAGEIAGPSNAYYGRDRPGPIRRKKAQQGRLILPLARQKRSTIRTPAKITHNRTKGKQQLENPLSPSDNVRGAATAADADVSMGRLDDDYATLFDAALFELGGEEDGPPDATIESGGEAMKRDRSQSTSSPMQTSGKGGKRAARLLTGAKFKHASGGRKSRIDKHRSAAAVRMRADREKQLEERRERDERRAEATRGGNENLVAPPPPPTVQGERTKRRHSADMEGEVRVRPDRPAVEKRRPHSAGPRAPSVASLLANIRKRKGENLKNWLPGEQKRHGVPKSKKVLVATRKPPKSAKRKNREEEEQENARKK